ncbi:MAG: hypothetical protein Fues2KO_13200 [Fuerstiella sp.]
MEDRCLLAAFVVDTVIDESDGNLSAGDLSLREAIESANSQAGPDTISFSPTVFGTAQQIDLVHGEFAVTDALTITGPGQNLLTIDAQQNSRHFNIDDGDDNNLISVEISGLTLTNGLATDGNDSVPSVAERGGAVFSTESIVLASMTFSENESKSFGGALSSAGTAEVRMCTFNANTSSHDGAGVFVAGSASVETSLFVDNFAAHGAGLANYVGASSEIRDSSFARNRASSGAGISNQGSMLIERVLLKDNFAGKAAAITNRRGNLIVLHTTISGNRVSGTGSALSQDIFGPQIVISHSTITGNVSRDSTGAAIRSDGPVTLNHSIVAGNGIGSTHTGELHALGRDIHHGYGSLTGSFNVIGDPESSARLTHGSNGNIVGQDDGSGGREMLDVSTVLGPLADNGGLTQTHALLPGSPAIDAGDPDFDPSSFDPPLTTDQRGSGFSRVADGNGDNTARIDIGAYERPAAGRLVITESGGMTLVGESSSPDSLTVALNRAPLQPVVVNLTVGSPPVVSTSTASLTFSPQNWNQPQTVTVSGVNDSAETGNLNTSVTVSVDDGQSDDYFDGASESVSVTFIDDESPLPTLSVADAPAVDEGTDAVFTVTLSSLSASAVTVRYDTQDGAGAGGAVGGQDFTSQSAQTLTFSPGETQKTISIATTDDTDDEDTETFGLTLSDPVGATITTAAATGTIDDNDHSITTVTGPLGASDNTRPTITWEAVSGATSYELWLQLLGGDSNPVVNPTVTGTSFELTTDLGIGRYRAWVRAAFDGGARTEWATADFQINSAPEISSLPPRGDDRTPTITWNAVNGATAYRVFVRNQTSTDTVVDTTATTTSFTPSADFNFGRHQIWVQAIAAGNYGAAWSDMQRYYLGPDLLTPTASTFNQQPEFTWTSIEGIASYQLYVQRGGTVVINESGLTSASYTPSTELPVGQYRWWVRPFHANGNGGAWSERGEFFAGGRPAVTGLDGTITTGIPTIQWQAVEGAGFYEVYLFNDDGQGLLHRVSNITGTTFAADPVPNGNYRVWIRSYHANGDPGIWSRPHSFVVNAATSSATATPAQPVATTFDTTPDFEWTGASGAARYDLYLKSGQTTIAQTDLNSTSWTPSTALATGPWHWWVRAKTASGAPGPWSARQTTDTSGRTTILSPSGSTSDRRPAVTWASVDGATHYMFQLDNLTTGQNNVIRENHVTDNLFIPSTELTPGSYRAWVRAVDGTNGVNAPWSFRAEFEVT